MAETKVFTFGLNEVVELLIKKQDIHEGLWAFYTEFGFGVANIPMLPDGKTFQPAVINVLNKVGIQRFDSPTNLTVDAAKINPLKSTEPESEPPIKSPL